MLPAGIHTLIRQALEEDLGGGDHTSLACIPANARGSARLLVKSPGVLAGVELAEAIAEIFDERLHLRVLIQDGARVQPGDIAFTITGPSRSIVGVERVLLNFMQRMSGIATITRAFVDAVQGTRCRVADTRKTTPALRSIEKWAVRIGGGTNHRMGLYDMVLIKDNHADFCGGLPQAIRSAQEYLATHALDLKIEVECRNARELEQVLAAGGVQRIMLDNFTPSELKLAVDRIGSRYETEASGGITLDTAREYASTGVDLISVGALTHSAVAMDLSLKAM
ncbi:MAG: carboxylating nicotinate-nucleotide diphosphorylase [Flavobacteriales bacterium]|nr:carboxylating nicotinate-nucleotide diphosphorylase [Flavobacteriales bacterium]